jgi:hypothetical protein
MDLYNLGSYNKFAPVHIFVDGIWGRCVFRLGVAVFGRNPCN